MTSPLTTTAAAATALLTSPMVTESVVEEFAGSSPQNEIAAETTDDLPRSLSGARTRYELPDAKAPVHIISQGEAMADLVALKTRIRNIDHFARENPRSRQDYRYLPQAITDALIADLRQSPAYEDLASHSPEPDQNHTGIFPDADTLLAVAGTDLNNSFHTSPAFQYFTKLGKVATNLREQAYQHWKTEAF